MQDCIPEHPSTLHLSHVAVSTTSASVLPGCPRVPRSLIYIWTVNFGGGTARGNLITIYKSLKCEGQVNGDKLFSMVSNNTKRGNGKKLEHRKFCTRKNFTVRLIEHWNKVPTEVVESPFLEAFKNHLDLL